MADSFSKREREKKKRKKKEDKAKRRKERAESDSATMDEMIAYVDEFGNIVDEPPDPSQKTEIKVEDIEVSVPKSEPSEDEDPVRKGTVSYFNDSKGFGFIIDGETGEKYFTHVSGHLDDIQENDRVTFELIRGERGMNAVEVKRQG